ncbi:MAG: hypothetical protein MUE98_10720 [Rhodobacteraceae bacterium]|jgi:hypothetical protein|nr:hypothetical protein [Paracoccaceae bacterium]
MLKIIGESLLIATRMDRAYEPSRDQRQPAHEAEASTRTRTELLRLPRFWA